VYKQFHYFSTVYFKQNLGEMPAISLVSNTNSVEQSLSREANSRSGVQDISRLL